MQYLRKDGERDGSSAFWEPNLEIIGSSKVIDYAGLTSWLIQTDDMFVSMFEEICLSRGVPDPTLK